MCLFGWLTRYTTCCYSNSNSIPRIMCTLLNWNTVSNDTSVVTHTHGNRTIWLITISVNRAVLGSSDYTDTFVCMFFISVNYLTQPPIAIKKGGPIFTPKSPQPLKAHRLINKMALHCIKLAEERFHRMITVGMVFKKKKKQFWRKMLFNDVYKISAVLHHFSVSRRITRGDGKRLVRIQK